MPALKVPDSLVTASIKTISCGFLKECHMEERDYFLGNISYLPVKLFNVVVEEIIKNSSTSNSLYSKPETVTGLFTSTITVKLTYLDLSPLNSVTQNNVYPHFIKAFLHVLPSLKNLLYLHLCRMPARKQDSLIFCDDILYSIGKYCNLLKYLNVGENSVREQAVMCLIPSDEYKGCPDLEELHLEHGQLSASAIVQLLETLPNITNMDCPDLQNGLIFFHKYSGRQNYNVQLKLKCLYLNMPRFRKEIPSESEVMPSLLCISKLCPRIETISFKSNDNDFSMLHLFSKVSTLDFGLTDNLFGHEINRYLTDYGANLTSLSIACVVFNTDFFLPIGRTCPTLKDLRVRYFCIPSDLEPGVETALSMFTFLSSFTLESIFLNETLVPINAIQLILKGTSSLTHLKLNCKSSTFTDASFEEVWNTLKKQSLVSVFISSTYVCDTRVKNRLTMSTVRLILDSCPLLKKLGDLYDWNISKEEVESLKVSLKKSNYDIEIIFSG